MTDDPIDRDLRQRFQELRQEVSSTVPPFTAPAVESRRRRFSRWVPATAGLATAAAAVVLALLSVGDPTPQYDLGLSSVVWSAPTDFLLDTPGSDLLRALPSIGADPRLFAPVESERIADDTLG